MMRSLFSAVSGLKTHQQRMDVIGNNIANVNTPGFKKSRVTFQDMLYQTLRGASRPVEGGRGGTNPLQVGPGVTIGSIDTIMSTASLQETGKMTDLGIDGEGFFILAEKEGGREFYTRVGSFDFDSNGNLVSNLNGMHVKGWMADEKGNIERSPKTFTVIKIDLQKMGDPQATSNMVFGGNLDTLKIFELKFQNGTNTETFEIQDSSNPPNTANLKITFTPSRKVNNDYVFTWSITDLSGSTEYGRGTINVGPDGKVTGNDGQNAKIMINGNECTITPPSQGNPSNFTLSLGFSYSDGIEPTSLILPSPITVINTVYGSNGASYNIVINFNKIDHLSHIWEWRVESVTDSKGNPVTCNSSGTIRFGPNGMFAEESPSKIEFLPDSADPVVIAPDFSHMTQYAAETTATVQSQDGYSSGVLESLAIDQTGAIVGVFSNGTSRVLAQVALRRFTNPAGLLKAGNSLFIESSNSGKIDPAAPPGTSGYGTIKPGSLEMSNVDLSSEFTDLIVTQRGFQANSRVITASDEMLQELVNLKR